MPVTRSRRRLYEWRAHIARVVPFAGAAVGIAAAAWCIKIYYDSIKAYVDGAGPQHDLAVFLGGAGRVLAGDSPYAFHGDTTFAYPPFLAFVVAPLMAASMITRLACARCSR